MEGPNKEPPSKGDSTFRLLDLPAELQLRIFEFAVTEEKAIAITYSAWVKQHHAEDMENFMNGSRLHLTAWQKARDERCSTQPALTRTCRTIRADALKFYYQNNDFRAGVCFHENGKEFQITLAWLDQIGSTNMRLIRQLVISDHFADDDAIVDLQTEDHCIQRAETIFSQRWKANLEPLERGTVTENRVIFPASDASDS